MSVVCIYSRDEQCRHPHTHACKKETETLDTITQQTTHLSNHFYTMCYSTQPLGASATAWKKRTWTRENWRVLHGIMVINAPTNTHVVHSTLYHLPQHPRLRQVGHVDEDIVGWVPVKRCTQSLLVKVVSDEPDRAAKHEQAV